MVNFQSPILEGEFSKYNFGGRILKVKYLVVLSKELYFNCYLG